MRSAPGTPIAIAILGIGGGFLQPAVSDAAVSCSYEPTTRTLEVAMTADEAPDTARLRRDPSGQILVSEFIEDFSGEFPTEFEEPRPCRSSGGSGEVVQPTVTDTDAIDVVDQSTDGGRLEIFASDGGFSPGATPETDPAEVEISFTTASAGGEIAVSSPSATDQTVELGRSGPAASDEGAINLNAANEGQAESDADISFDGVFWTTIYTGSGDDLIDGSGGETFPHPATQGGFFGTWAGNDRIVGPATSSELPLPPGAFRADGGEGEDEVIGTAVDDSLAGGAGRDLIEGGEGPDSLHSGDLSNFSPPGGPGGIEDRLLGGTGDDFLQGTRSNDHFDGGPGSDTVFPGSPDRLRSPELRVDLRIQGTPQDTGDGGHDTLFSVEGAFGDDGPDVLIGDGQANFLYGSSESDLLVGGGGDDEIDGGGTWHVDTASYGAPFSTPTAGVAVTFSGPAKAEAINGDDVDSLTSIRRIVGTPYPDQLLGAKGPQRLIGGRGPDRLSGGPGPDALRGSRGADHLTGGAARDGLLGGPGIDRLFALDDQRDRLLACGRGADLRERVRRDAIDPEPISC